MENQFSDQIQPNYDQIQECTFEIGMATKMPDLSYRREREK